ncbi:MAG: CCA tRNA nucleotidyltransferase [Acidobacteria bacterium]|nr:CCA tRNA nucleotidyltransferase [Acidobacteriota bacterium]
MSDYMYMLESHLSPDQNRVIEAVQTAAGEAGVNVFLTGGAMRDMLAGFPIRDLDFVVEGNALKVAHAVCERGGAKTVHIDESRKAADLVFASGVTAQIAMSRQEKYARGGARSTVSAATIQEDLRGRDFTCNAIALSLNRASRGLLLDPMNGLADIERRELRAVSTYGFYDDPSRLLRLVRFSVRLGFTVEERTRMQVANAREAEVEARIPPRVLSEELRRIGAEDRAPEIIKGLEEAGLLRLFSPVLGAKLNHQALTRLEKAVALLPDDSQWRGARFGVFMDALTANLTPKEKAALVKTTEVPKRDIAEWQKLEARAKKLESALKSPRIRKASQVYQIVSAAAPDEVLFTLCHSALKPVQERLRSHFAKYLPQIAEILPEEWATIPVKPGTPKYAKARETFIAQRLDRRVKKPVEPPPPTVVPVVETAGRRGR